MPRLGIGLPISAAQTQASVLVIDDPLFESFGGNDIAVNYTATRTNLTLYAQDTTQSQWIKTSTGIEGTLYEDPDGGTTANAITGAASNSTKFIHQVQSVTAGETYTYSAYIKKAALGFAILEVSDGTTTYSGNFNLTDGAVATTTRLITSAIDDRSNGWYRCSITFQALNSSEGGQIRAYATAADNTPTVNVAVADTVLVYIWGQQFEADGEPTDYIVTTTEARTATTLLNDLSKTWDFDSNDIMPEADPDGEGSWETLPNVVLNGDYEELGSELVTNGDFSSASGWSGSISVSGGQGTKTSGGLAYRSGVITAGKQYKIVVDVASLDGTTNIYAGGNNSAALTVGLQTIYMTGGSSNNFLGLNNGYSSSVGSVFNSISVKQFDPNDRWTLGTGWTIEDGKLVGTSVSTQFAQQSLTLTSGTSYEVTFSITGADTLLNNNSFRYPYDGAVSNINYLPKDSPDGTYTNVFTSTGSSILYLGYIDAGTFTGTIDNVTVREYAIQPQDV